MTLPSIATVYLTNHCQHRCPHCFLTRRQLLQSAHLSKEKVTSYLEQLSRNKVLLIALAGGDPFLHPDIEKIIRKIVDLKMLPLLACNPSKEFELKIPLLKELKIKTVQFSLDSPFDVDHDRSRGKGSFEATLAMIQRISKENIKSNLSVCVTRGNIEQMEAMVFLADRIGVFKLKLVFWESDGLAEDWSVSEVQKLALAGRISNLRATTRPVAEWVALPDYDLTKAVRMRYSMPELVVSADGNVTSSDFSKMICRIDEPLIARRFADYVEVKKISFLQKIIDESIFRLSKKVNFYDTDLEHKAAAAVLSHGNAYHIFLERNLPPIVRELNILHEIGHIETRTLSKISTQTDHDYLAAERAANGWLIDRLADYLDPAGIALANCLEDSEFTAKMAKAIRAKFYIF